jgi:hypothetical protein
VRLRDQDNCCIHLCDYQRIKTSSIFLFFFLLWRASTPSVISTQEPIVAYTQEPIVAYTQEPTLSACHQLSDLRGIKTQSWLTDKSRSTSYNRWRLPLDSKESQSRLVEEEIVCGSTETLGSWTLLSFSLDSECPTVDSSVRKLLCQELWIKLLYGRS